MLSGIPAAIAGDASAQIHKFSLNPVRLQPQQRNAARLLAAFSAGITRIQVKRPPNPSLASPVGMPENNHIRRLDPKPLLKNFIIFT
jgi:hypothetical protein